jgi:hypothetical protein
MVLKIKGLKIPSSKDEITNLDQRVTEHPDQLRRKGVVVKGGKFNGIYGYLD